MKVVQINTNCGDGSTGRLCVSVSKLLTGQGIENYVFYTLGKSEYPLGKLYMSALEGKIQALKSRVLGNYGFNSRKATKALICELDRIHPDVVHLHNMHGHNCHLDLLFSYFKKNHIRVLWTFHDCWAFTAYCPHYDMNNCQKWKTACKDCRFHKKYSWFYDRSASLFQRKKDLLSNMDMTIVAPSQWMAEQVKQSFLCNCEVKVIHNGINLDVFVPRESDFREKYSCTNKYIVLGVANIWVYQKGLPVFIELSKRLGRDYQVIMVGTDDDIDRILPDNIISIHRTQSEKELAEIYTAADVFINPTLQEVFGLTNVEALACGTPVITYNTGGSPECIDENCGVIVEKGNVDVLEQEIRRICTQKPISAEETIRRSKSFSIEKMYQRYMDLYY